MKNLNLNTSNSIGLKFKKMCVKDNSTSYIKKYFRLKLFILFLSCSVNRLRQKNPDSNNGYQSDHDPPSVGCTDLDDNIHVKVSVFVKRSNRGGNYIVIFINNANSVNDEI